MILKFNKELYPKEALIKAAYHFTDTSYVYLNQDNTNYIVEITPKIGENEVIESEFKNEMLAQSVRHAVFLQTRNIREIIVGRAFASSLICTDFNNSSHNNAPLNDSLESILTDWFDKYEK